MLHNSQLEAADRFTNPAFAYIDCSSKQPVFAGNPSAFLACPCGCGQGLAVRNIRFSVSRSMGTTAYQSFQDGRSVLCVTTGYAQVYCESYCGFAGSVRALGGISFLPIGGIC